MTAPRTLVVSHTYTAPINHAKLQALADLVPLAAIAPARWRDSLFEVQAPPVTAPFVLHRLPIAGSGHVLRYFFPPVALARVVRQAQPQVVYVEAEPPSLALAQLAWLKPRRHFRLVAFTWENIVRRGGWPGLERFNLARCDGMIAGNQAAAGVLRRKGFQGPVSITPQLGVDPEVFQPGDGSALRRHLDLGGFLVGYVGRLVQSKGLRVLLEAVEPLPEVQLLIVGSGPLRPELEQWAARWPGRCCVLSAVSHQEVAGVLRALDVLVLPSLTTPTWKEQFGHTLIEAMACGVATAGSTSGAIPEVIGEAGLIVPEGQSADLRQAIVRLQTDPVLRARLGRAGRERVLAHYTHARIAAANVAFFTEVLAR